MYLRAIENRLTQDGYILLSAAVDDLCGGRNKMKPQDMRAALVAAGQTPAMNTLERVSSVRGRLIHNGMVDLAEMYTAWYDLEEITRVLLRHRAELDGGWPARVPMYEGPSLAEPRIADVQQEQAQIEPPAQSLLQVLDEGRAAPPRLFAPPGDLRRTIGHRYVRLTWSALQLLLSSA